MIEKTYTKDQWQSAVMKLALSEKVIAPVKKGAHTTFDVLESNVQPDFETLKTRLSPKGVLFPQSERMFNYSLDPADEERGILKDDKAAFEPQSVVGLRPCDAFSFELVKLNFDTPEYRDPWWTGRYDMTTFVGAACNQPGQTCFCTSVGAAPHGEAGLDVLTTDLGDTLYVRALTEKGEKWLAKLEGGDAANGEHKAKSAELAKVSASKVPSKVETGNLKKLSEKELFEAPFWKTIAEGCINCGACTFSCPTCWCFDIQDETSPKEKQGDRMRNWDSCMFPLFTRHSSGHNPRGEKYQRVRQRFMHKLKYYLERQGEHVLCVGCGRCVELCPANIDIRTICETMNAYVGKGE